MIEEQSGLFEVLITEAVEQQLEELGDDLVARPRELRPAEAADRIALHISRVIERAVNSFHDGQRRARGVELAREIIDRVDTLVSKKKKDFSLDRPIESGEVLSAIFRRDPGGNPHEIAEPLIPLLDTTLLTNAPGEPRVGHQLGTEIESADRIDIVVAFIRLSGIRPLLQHLKDHCANGKRLRVLTTTYTGSTELRALESLQKIGADIRVSYDTKTTRLHAKAWLFHRESGFSTAYIGSSNLTHSAQVSGLEWNVRVSGARNPDVLGKVAAVFESYWHAGEFVPFDAEEFERHGRPSEDKTSHFVLPAVEIRPEPFQERLLEQVELSRSRGHHRNLIAAATGTGKTVMAALDYARLRKKLPRSRLLFVAHRREILQQSRSTFCLALRDPSFGEMWVDGQRPRRYEHVFASIQSLNASGLEQMEPDHFDVVIVDEFHHAAAKSYDRILTKLEPRELLGLTATPERADNLPVLHWFDNRIAAELRLWDAIDQHRLSPFSYYGVYDGLDLRDVPWKRGSGYDVDGLTNVLTASDVWARHVVEQLHEKAENPETMRVLGFCVGVEHARYMARIFNEAKVSAKAVWADTPDEERKAALRNLESGSLKVVFSVDLFNEGVDVPNVDTLLLLRPTDSPTLFLQQLGRGLRRHEGKTVCTVLDFVGQHRREFRVDRRFRALLGGTRKSLTEQVEQGFPFLPAGCHMELDEVSSEIVFKNIRESIPSVWSAKVDELKHSAKDGRAPSLSEFLEQSGLDLEDLYSGTKSWSDLLEDARLIASAPGPEESALRRACGRLLHVDDSLRIETYRRFLEKPKPPQPERLLPRDRRLLRMLVGSVVGGKATKTVDKTTSLEDGAKLLWEHPQVRSELLELLDVLEDRITHVPADLADLPNVPLQIHARYTRIEILAAFGIGNGAKVAPWQTGVYFAENVPADLLAFTLDKTSGQFSPTTRYRDYAISRELIHWESQSVTRAESKTGLRYQRHGEMGSHVMLFARLKQDDRAFFFLGPADYVGHEGEQPMGITWKLKVPLPGDLYASFAAAVA